MDYITDAQADENPCGREEEAEDQPPGPQDVRKAKRSRDDGPMGDERAVLKHPRVGPPDVVPDALKNGMDAPQMIISNATIIGIEVGC